MDFGAKFCPLSKLLYWFLLMLIWGWILFYLKIKINLWGTRFSFKRIWKWQRKQLKSETRFEFERHPFKNLCEFSWFIYRLIVIIEHVLELLFCKHVFDLHPFSVFPYHPKELYLCKHIFVSKSIESTF